MLADILKVSSLVGALPANSSVRVSLSKIIRQGLGFIYCIFILIFFLLSIPVYAYRLIVIRLAKILRPDLGDILNGQSALFAVDYFIKTPPRSNLVSSLVFQGHLTKEEVERRVLKNWINVPEEEKGKLGYNKFLQYPVKWMGFVFWKNTADPFSVKNHVFQLYDKDALVTEEEMTAAMEKLLNTRLPGNRSPWTLHVIENLRCSQNPTQRHSAFIFTIHHTLCDGTGVSTSVLEGILEHPGLAKEIRQREIRQAKRTFWQKVLFTGAFIFNTVRESSHAFSYNFRFSPYKIPDKKKDWRQVLSRAEPIPIQRIKDIKNAAGVSFTSVLLAALSAAVEKSLKAMVTHPKNKLDFMPCMSVLPARGFNDRQLMANHMTGVVFDLPVEEKRMKGDHLQRLKTIDGILGEKKTSVFPVVAQLVSTLMGAHLLAVTDRFSRNSMIPITLSNFATISASVQLNDNSIKLIHCDSINGGFVGETGVVVLATSYDQHIKILVSAERGLMSKKEVEQFMKSLVAEIETLEKLLVNRK